MSLGLVRDVLNSKPFQFADMTEAANDIIPYKPGQVGALGIFEEESLFTDTAYISERAGKLGLVPTSQRGGPSVQITPPKSKLRTVQTFRLSEEDQINASELFNVARFHVPNALENLATIRDQRLTQMADALDFTDEHMKLNALLGLVLDADLSTLVDINSIMGVTPYAEYGLDVTNTTAGNFYKKLQVLRRQILGDLEADAGRTNHIHVMCDPDLFDGILTNVDVISWAKVPPNSAFLSESRVFGTFPWMGFIFEEYRVGVTATASGGSWLGSTKGVAFPVGPSIYKVFYSPGEHFGALNAPGIPRYARAAADATWDEWIKLKLQSYPLPIVLRPLVLRKVKAAA